MNRLSACRQIMATTRPALLACVLALGMLSGAPGCQTVSKMLGGKPTASLAGASIQNVDLQGAEMLFDVSVSNPYDVPLPLTDLSYALTSGDKQFLTGKANLGSEGLPSSIPAKGTKTLKLPAKVTFSELMSVMTNVKPGTLVPYKADIALGVDAPGVGPLEYPMSKEGSLPVPAAPEISAADLKWDKLSFSEAAGTMSVNVKNTNQFALNLSNMNYNLKLGGSDVASSTLARPLSLTAGEQGTIQVPVSFSPQQLGLAAFNMLSGNAAPYDFTGSIAASTPFGPMTLPFNKAGQLPLLGK